MIRDIRHLISSIERPSAVLDQILDSVDALIYVADMETYELLYINRQVRDQFGDICGKICWQTLQSGQNGPCPFCTNNALLDEHGRPGPPVAWEFCNTVNKIWYDVRDKAIPWENGKYVRLEIATDISNKKVVAEKLLAEQQLNTTLLDTVAALVIVMDRQGRIVRFNHSCEETTGYTFREIQGKIAWEVLIPDEQVAAVEQVFRHLRGGQFPNKHENYWKTKDGSKRLIAWDNSALIDDFGEVEFVIATGIDITETRKAEEELLLFRDLINNSNDAVYIIDPERATIIECNRCACTNLLFTKEELVGKHFFEIDNSANQDLDNWKRQARTIKNQGDVIYQSDHFRKDGSTYPVEVNAQFVTAREKNYMVAIARDLTLRNELQEKIIKAKKDWEDAFDIINDAITIHDENFNILRANKAAEKLLGKSLKEILKIKCFESYHGTCYAPKTCPSCRALKTGDVSITEMFEPNLGKYLEIKALPRLDANGQIIGLIHVVRDITERQKAEQEQKNLQQQLLQSQKLEAVGQLAGGVAHDFNNLLTGILGFTGLAMEQIDRESPVAEDLQEVISLGKRAESLTRQLLAFSRRQPMDPVEIGLNTLIDNLGKMLRRLIGDDVTLQFDLAAAPDTITADPGQIEQIVINLAVNARHAMQNGGVLTIGTGNVVLDGSERFYAVTDPIPGNYLNIRITDTGCGMDQETREQVFAPFFTTKGVGHSGLGLAMIYGIVKNHKGYIEIHSEKNIGTSISIFLPEKFCGDQPGGTLQDVTIPVTGTILVVDAEKHVLKIMKKILTKLGHTVYTADSCEEARRQMVNHMALIDLVLCELIMPRRSAVDIYEELRQLKPELKVVFMSGYAANQQTIDYIRKHNIPLLEKPLSSSQLAGIVNALLQQRP